MISVYQNKSGFRVVRGEHKVAAEHKNQAPRTYGTVREAYQIEGDASIKAALLRIDSSVAEIPASEQHHIVRKGTSGMVATDFNLYRAALAADEAFQGELVRVYGAKKATGYRYQIKPYADVKLEAAKDAKLVADEAWLTSTRVM